MAQHRCSTHITSNPLFYRCIAQYELAKIIFYLKGSLIPPVLLELARYELTQFLPKGLNDSASTHVLLELDPGCVKSYF